MTIKKYYKILIAVVVLLILFVIYVVTRSNGNYEIHKSIDFTDSDISSVKISKGVGVSAPQWDVVVSYVGKDENGFIVNVRHKNNTTCENRNMVLPLDNVYECGSTKYRIDIDENKSNEQSITINYQKEKK